MTVIKRRAAARWSGDVENGAGQIDVGRTGPTLDFSLRTRIGDADATNPEELVGAALAGCLSMSFANELGNAGIAFESVATTATVHLTEGDGGFAIPRVDLAATVTGADADVERLAEVGRVAESNCPVSKLYRADIALTVDTA